MSYDHGMREAIAGRRGEQDRNLSWFDWSFVTGIADDGSRIAFEEQRATRGRLPNIYVRTLDGSPAIYLGEGRVRGFSPDGKWLLARLSAEKFELLPVGAGESRIIPIRGIEETVWWYWFPDGRRVLLWGNEPGQGTRM